MDEDTMLELLAEYSGNWKDRQYYEHIVREIQKKHHLAQLIQEHNHDPRDQLMLEASKRKTVIEIEKKYQQSSINSTYVYPRNISKNNGNNSTIDKALEDAMPDDDSYNTSLDVDFYNLKAQNSKKKKPITKAGQGNEAIKGQQQTSSTHIKTNINQSQQSNESNSLSPISRAQQQQSHHGAGPLTHNKGINSAAANASINKSESQKQVNINLNLVNNNENQLIGRNQQRDDGDEKNSKAIRSFLNQSSDKNQNTQSNINLPLHQNANTHPLNNNNQSSQINGAVVISPNKQISKQGVNEVFSPSQVFNDQNQQQQVGNKNNNIGTYVQQQYQKTFLQNQIIKQQQQAMLRTSQEAPQQIMKVKNDRSNHHGQKDKEQDQSDSGVGTRLNTCTNDVEKDPEIINKAQKQTKSQSNSPISKVNGQAQNINNYYYLSPQNNQQLQQNQTFSSVPNTQNPQMKSNNTLLNQNQQQQQSNKGNSQKQNPFHTNKNDIQSVQKQRNQQQFTSAIPKGNPPAQQTMNGVYSNSFLSTNKNQNLSSGSGKEVQNPNQKQGQVQSSQKEINKHSNAIESILYRQQQQHYAAGGLMQPHQILNTQESANGNEDSTLSLNQVVQQSAKSQQQQQHNDSDQQQILKQIHSQNQNQNNIYSSKKLYQLNTNLANTNNLSSQQQSQLQQQQNQQNITHNKQRKLVQQNGTNSNFNQNSSNHQHSHSPLASHSQQNIIMQNNSQIQYIPSNDNISSNHNLDTHKTNPFNNTQQIQINSQIPHSFINNQVAYLNDNVLSTQPYSDHQTSTNPNHLNSDDISQNSMAIDTQRKSSVRSKRSGAPNGNQDESEHRLSSGNNQNQGQNVQFSQTHSSQFKNKWIDFKKINQQYKGSERLNGGAINQTQFEDNAQNSAAANYRNTFSSVSPNGHQSSSNTNNNNNNNKKGSSSINNYLSLSTAINNIGNTPQVQQNASVKNKQGLTSSMTQSNHYQNGATNNPNLTHQTLTKTMSQNQNQPSNIATTHLNIQHLQNSNSQELAAYQIKSGKLGLTENQSVDKNYHTQFINNAKQFHQQQQFILQQNQAQEESNQNSGMSTKNVQRKQINKVNSCKSFEIRDKFSKTTSKNNANNVIINLSNVNNSNTNHHNLYVQNLNHTTGNHNMSQLNNNNTSNMNSSTLNQNNTNIQSSLTVSTQNNNSQNKQNLLTTSSNIISYLPSSQNKNTYSAALYQKSQNNILSKQAKNPTESSMSNLFNNMHSSSSNNMLSNSTITAASGQNGVNSSINLARNTSQNPSGSVSQSINNMNLNSYLTSHNQNSTTKLAKKIDMYKVFNSTNSNSFSNQKETQQSSVKQVKNLGLVLQKIIKNKTLKINEKSNQLNQQIQMANSSIQNNLASASSTNQAASAAAKKQSTPGKKKMSTSGPSQQNNTINNSTLKSPQFSTSMKKNYI